MKLRQALTGVIVVLSIVMEPVFAEEGECESTKIEGYWQGSLKVRANLDVTIVFHVSARPDGTLGATMDVPAQRLKDIPVDRVSCRKGRLRFEVNAIPAVFDGQLEQDGSVATGRWTQGSDSLPLVLKRVEKPLEASGRPQEPKRPYPYDDEDVTYENRQAGIRLNGTMTLPRSVRPAPAVVLISGGGPQDRDQSVLGHKPFLVLADYLTRRGIAVLRADDRGFEKIRNQEDAADFLKATTEDFAGDALAGVEYLKTRKEIDSKRIGLIGHSEGGLVAPLAAVSSPDVAFIVLLAASGQTTEEAHHRQCYFILRDAGATSKAIRHAEDHYRRVFDMIRREKDDAVPKKTLREMEAEMLAKLSNQEKEWMALLDRTMAGNPAVILSPWLRYLLTYDPRATLRKVECPVLALIGEKDVQVPASDNLPLIEQALKAGGHEDFTVKELPGLNHLFQTCTTGMPTEYGTIEETFSPGALKIVGDWILEHVKAP